MKFVLAFVIFTNLLFANTKKITLDEAIEIALQNNKQNKISKLGLQIAQAQYKQALSANYPTINAMIVGKRVKEDRLFQMRGDITLPSSTAKALTMSTLLSQGLDLTTAQATLNAMPSSTFENNTLAIDTDAPVYGKDTVKGSINLLYPIYSGGKITAIIDQAKLNKLLASNSVKRDELNVVFETKKYFYGYVLTKELLDIALNTLDRMKYVEELTKSFYEHGESLNVKKTDYLSIQVTVALIESVVAKLQANEILVKSALINALGLPYNSDIKVIYKQKLMPVDYTLDKLVKQAYETNSDINKMDIALKISDKKIDEKQAGHYPSLAFLAEVSHTYNSYEFGILNEEQENDWHVGFAANMPLFDGFKTTNSVLEQKLEKRKIYLLKDMLKEGIALQIKSELTNALIGYKQIQTLNKAKRLAKESRKLNIRAYQIDAVEPKDVVQAQYVEAYVKADYLKYVHDYMVSLAKIDKLVGKELK